MPSYQSSAYCDARITTSCARLAIAAGSAGSAVAASSAEPATNMIPASTRTTRRKSNVQHGMTLNQGKADRECCGTSGNGARLGRVVAVAG
jgi:hypothetical protein